MALGPDKCRRFVIMKRDELAITKRLAKRDCRSWSSWMRRLAMAEVVRHEGACWRDCAEADRESADV